MIEKSELKQILQNIVNKKSRKEILNYVKRLQEKYGFNICQYLTYEAEGSICAAGHGNDFGRCIECCFPGKVCLHRKFS